MKYVKPDMSSYIDLGEIELPEHQILLSFNSDELARQFDLWWTRHGGEDLFRQFVEEEE